jgi:uncharacterized protein (DUF302 family)
MSKPLPAPDGLITAQSRNAPKETMDRFVTAVSDRGMSIMARIDHAAAAQNVGLELRPTEVLIFGNPRGGTPLMQAVQTLGIDLPLKALVWQDEDGQTWLSYNDPAWLARRHHAGDMAGSALAAMSAALSAAANKATEPGTLFA